MVSAVATDEPEIAAKIAHRRVREIEQIIAVKAHATGNLGGSFRQQSHDRESGDALAAAGFTDEPQRHSWRQVETYAFDRVGYPAAVAVKYDP